MKFLFTFFLSILFYVVILRIARVSLFLFQIPSYDSNSHCLCVAGEVYCWWQNYNPSTVPTLGPSSLQSTTTESDYTSYLGAASTDVADGFEASGDTAADSPPAGQQGRVEINATSSTTSPSVLTTCLVMGIKPLSYLSRYSAYSVS